MPVLVLQRGHVARTRGATGGPHEQATARAVAAEVERIMPHAGWSVRVIDADEPHSRYRGDAFVSIHTDAAVAASAVGASVGYRNVAGRNLATRWKNAYRKHGWNRSFRADNYTTGLSGYYGHRHAVNQGNPVACIVELGFTTNAIERSILTSVAGRRRAALAIVEAVTGSVPGNSSRDFELGERVISTGDNGGDVATLQRLLNHVNVTNTGGRSTLKDDGAFGPLTATEVVHWGTLAGLFFPDTSQPRVGTNTVEALRHLRDNPLDPLEQFMAELTARDKEKMRRLLSLSPSHLENLIRLAETIGPGHHRELERFARRIRELGSRGDSFVAWNLGGVDVMRANGTLTEARSEPQPQE